MPKYSIYNCHIHTFTRKNTPPYILKLRFGNTGGYIISQLAKIKWILHLLLKFMRWLSPEKNDPLERYAKFAETGELDSQELVFKEIRKQYPLDTKFIVLPMDIEHIGLGEPAENIDKQHEDLLALASKSNGQIIPFYAADPRHDDIVQKVEKNLGAKKFRGIKIYPSLGYYPNDKKLMDIYKICETGGYPVIAHCSPGGIWKFGLTAEERRAYVDPDNYKEILKRHPKLKLCLAHFGGTEEWEKHLNGRSGGNQEDAWIKKIYDMIDSRKYPNLYTDISYTVFMPRLKDMYIDLVDYLKVLLSNKRIQRRVLFGSDYYMTQQEELSEKEVSIMLRSRLGEDLYFQIANKNPREFLGIKTRKPKRRKKSS